MRVTESRAGEVEEGAKERVLHVFEGVFVEAEEVAEFVEDLFQSLLHRAFNGEL